MLLTDTTPPAPANQNQPGVDIVQQPPVSDDDLQDADPADISTADFIIMQSSFESFSSPRRPSIGSPFIRTLVTVFYKYAHQLHMEELAATIRQMVAKIGVQRTEYLLRTRTYNTARAHVASMPQTRCTFLTEKLYFQTGVNMRIENHPGSLTNPVLPNPTATRIHPESDETLTIQSEGRTVRQATYYKWSVR